MGDDLQYLMTWKRWFGEKWTLNGHEEECMCTACRSARFNGYDNSEIMVWREWWVLPVHGALWLGFFTVVYWWACHG